MLKHKAKKDIRMQSELERVLEWRMHHK